jgi:C1A family cysteine protease
VTFGTLLGDEWSGYEGETLTIPKNPDGGHAMVVVGWDSQRSAFIVKNSWGKYWGDGGYCYMSPEYMGWRNTWDLWVPTMGHNFK